MNSELRILKVSGNPFQRGVKHGEHFKKEIHAHMKLWKNAAEEELNMDIEDYLNRFYKETDFMPAIKKYAPDLLEEVKGIAKGAELPFDWVLARQLSDEEPWFRNTIKYGMTVPSNCTTVGLKGNSERSNIIGQNMDTPKYYDGSQLILEIEEFDSDLKYKMLTLVGKISLCGMNNYGVGITCNTVIQLDFNPKGLPEDFVVRKALQCRSFKEMKDFLMSVPHASGQNYMIGGPGGVESLECSANKVVSSMSENNGELYYHTNHEVVSDDSAFFTNALQLLKVKDIAFYDNLLKRMKRDTYKRYDTVKKLMENMTVLSVDGLIEVLKDRTSPLCIYKEDDFSNFTLATVVFELNKEKPEFNVCIGPPVNNRFYKLYF